MKLAQHLRGEKTEYGSIEALKLFNEKAKKLRGLPFTKEIFAQPSGVDMWWKKGIGGEVKRLGPDEPSIDAFVLTLRFFVQNNESCSFRNMAKVYENLPIPDDKKKSFEKARNFFNGLLDKYSCITIDDIKLKNRQIFETFMYGGLTHANRKKKMEYDKWLRTPLGPILTNEFVRIMAEILKAIFSVEKLNAEVIKGSKSMGRKNMQRESK